MCEDGVMESRLCANTSLSGTHDRCINVTFMRSFSYYNDCYDWLMFREWATIYCDLTPSNLCRLYGQIADPLPGWISMREGILVEFDRQQYLYRIIVASCLWNILWPLWQIFSRMNHVIPVLWKYMEMNLLSRIKEGRGFIVFVFERGKLDDLYGKGFETMLMD